MVAEILCIGTEILLGNIVNTNATFISNELANMGISVYYQTVVGDNPDRLKSAIEIALSRSDIIITSGGLGPTYDDLSKEIAAKCFNREMKLHEESLEHIKNIFKKLDREMTENNIKQAFMPEGAYILKNSMGTAPGVAIEQDNKHIIMLPGPPKEMKNMFVKEVKPYLENMSNAVFLSHNIHVFGLGESYVESILKDKMESYTNPTIAPYAKESEVLLRVTASAKTEQEAEKKIAPVIEEIKNIIGEYIYGIDIESMQNAVVQKLISKGLTLATAESCTGGLISQMITQIPGSSEIFLGGVCSYSNSLKSNILGVSEETLEKYGAVSEQTALEMARGVRKITGSDIAISSTGIAGPGGSTEDKPVGLVYIAIDSENYGRVLELNLGRGYSNERTAIRYSASLNALNLILKTVEKL